MKIDEGGKDTKDENSYYQFTILVNVPSLRPVDDTIKAVQPVEFISKVTDRNPELSFLPRVVHDLNVEQIILFDVEPRPHL
jgi:hypothetical protein